MRNLVVLVLAIFVTAAGARADYEGATFGVEKYGGSGECCCSDLSYTGDAASSARYALLALGYSPVQFNLDQAVDSRDWVDAGLYPDWGRDNVAPSGTDWADVAFYSGHGNHMCSSIHGYYSEITMGDNSGPSSPLTCSPQTHLMRFGEGASSASDLNVLILAGCETVQRCVWEHGGYDGLDGEGAPSTGFNVINGFHGSSYDQATLPANVQNYILDSKYDGIGDNWIDEMTDFANWPWEPADQCPTSVVLGDSRTSRANQFNNGGFRDLKSTGFHTGSSFFYIAGCDPDDGEQL